MPLGEMLVNEGLIDRDDLQTALALKLGYPLVDLSRFPIDPLAARQLSQRVLLEHRVVPLVRRGDWLVVAVDDLARIPRLQALQALAALKVVPVLAARAHCRGPGGTAATPGHRLLGRQCAVAAEGVGDRGRHPSRALNAGADGRATFLSLIDAPRGVAVAARHAAGGRGTATQR